MNGTSFEKNAFVTFGAREGGRRKEKGPAWSHYCVSCSSRPDVSMKLVQWLGTFFLRLSNDILDMGTNGQHIFVAQNLVEWINIHMNYRKFHTEHWFCFFVPE